VVRLARRAASGERGVGLLFVVSALVAIAGQLSVTAHAKRRWRPTQAITVGLALMGAAFLPLAAAAPAGPHPPAGTSASLAGSSSPWPRC